MPDIPIQEAIRIAIESHMLDVHTALPANVIAFDPITCTATVAPAVRRALEGQDGGTVYETLARIDGVPVLLGAGLAPGDRVLLVFSEADSQAWEAQGGTVNPKDQTRHGLGSPFAVPFPAPGAPLTVGNPLTAQFVALASLVEANLTALKSAISGAVVGSGDGGATFKSNLLAALAAWPAPTGAVTLKASP